MFPFALSFPFVSLHNFPFSFSFYLSLKSIAIIFTLKSLLPRYFHHSNFLLILFPFLLHCTSHFPPHHSVLSLSISISFPFPSYYHHISLLLRYSLLSLSFVPFYFFIFLKFHNPVFFIFITVFFLFHQPTLFSFHQSLLSIP